MSTDTTTLPSIELQSENWQIALQAGMGLQTSFCKVQHHGQWLDIMPDCRQSDAKLSASNFHMLPYSNRIRDGQFSHAGKSYTLENAVTHAIHGALRTLVWRVTQQSEQSVTAEYDSRTDAQINWPWPIMAQITYTLGANTLASSLTLTNHGKNSMPAGMGWHPYFSRLIDGASPELLIPVDGVYPDTNGDCLPTGKSVPVPQALSFVEAKALDPTQRIDHCFSGFNAPAVLAWPDIGLRLAMQASTNCNHLVLYNPDESFFAVEPVTNANDGFNLVRKGVGAGVVTLEPGETMSAEMRLELTS